MQIKWPNPPKWWWPFEGYIHYSKRYRKYLRRYDQALKKWKEKITMEMNPEPGQSYSVASRCICAKCGKQPRIQAEGNDPVTITAYCHGQTERKNISKRELVFTQRFFDDAASDE